MDESLKALHALIRLIADLRAKARGSQTQIAEEVADHVAAFVVTIPDQDPARSELLDALLKATGKSYHITLTTT